MAKKNPTLNYFGSPGRRDGETNVSGPGPTEIPPNRVPVYRLGFTPHEVLTDWSLFARTIRESAMPDAAFFLDSSFLGRREIPREVWDALLSRQIVITPLVWDELQDWIKNPFANEWFRDLLISAKANGNDAILFLDTSTWPDDIRKSARYYIELLLTRKLIAHAEIDEFREKHGRDPEPEELTRILQTKVRDRGLVLAKKGLGDIGKANFAADEELVVCEVVYSLLSGRESSILTSDADLLEQFYKFCFLIDTHYRSMLIAENYASTPGNFLVQPLPHEGICHQSFEEGNIEALKLPRHFVEWVLPEEHKAVNVHCVRFSWDGDRMKASSLNFSGETQMARVLDVKGRSGGRSTEALGERNLHLMTSPPFPEGFGGNAIVGADRLVPFGNSQFPMIDLNYAVMEVERFRYLRLTDQSVEEERYVGLNLAAFRATERLLTTRPPEWMGIAVEDMTAAIRYFDPAAIFFADLAFLESDHADRYGETLLKKGFATTTHIRDALRARNSLCNAIRDADKRISLYDPTSQDAYEWGYGHYLGALAFRKLYWQVIKSQVLRDHGRESPDDEWPQIAEHYAGVRGSRLAEEGWARRDDPTLFYGEELLVQGMISGMYHGTDVVFLTSDPLFLDQFLKLSRLMREHYLSAEFGAAFAVDRSRFRPQEVSREHEASLGGFLGDRALCCDLAIGWEDSVLPKRPVQLNLHCWLFGRSEDETCTFMPFSFCAEQPMQAMLRVKGATGGLNVNSLDGHNVRLTSQGNNRPAVALIFEEEMVALGSDSFPADARLALRISHMPWTDLVASINNTEQAGSAWLDVP